jgi:hypothetical protein
MRAERKFRCEECGHLHEREWDAESCCPRDADEVWLCGECTEIHDAEQEAIDCCGGDPLDSEQGWQRHVEELEAAGQQRLID